MSVLPRVEAASPSGVTERLSYSRASLVAVLVAMAVFGMGVGLWKFSVAMATPAGVATVKTSTWYAPYVDVTLPPTYNFQDTTQVGANNVVLGFVVGGGSTGCTPLWGGSYDFQQAALKLDLDRRIVRLRQAGGDVVVSFGGAVNTELASSCTDTAALAQAYSSVIDHYGVSTIDFDLEGKNLTDIPAGVRRAHALAAIEGSERARGEQLNVWVTLGVTPTGLPADEITALDQLLTARVQLAGVNLLTMNYGASRPANQSMADASMAALRASAGQINQLYQAYGVHLSTKELHRMLGITPMIGQNSVLSDKFSLADATTFYNEALGYGVGRLSMWSLNRDTPCGGNANQSIASNWCSGVIQEPLAFSHLFASDTVPLPSSKLPRSTTLLGWSDTAVLGHALYDQWRQLREYVPGARVVWDGQVYQAKWWNVGQLPDAVVAHEWDSPWVVLGPVLPDEATTTTVPVGATPQWVSSVNYSYGTRVERHGIIYTAQWQNQGYDPASDPDNTCQNPWTPLWPAPGSDYAGANS